MLQWTPITGNEKTYCVLRSERKERKKKKRKGWRINISGVKTTERHYEVQNERNKELR